jgi:hypothetical protein
MPMTAGTIIAEMITGETTMTMSIVAAAIGQTIAGTGISGTNIASANPHSMEAEGRQGGALLGPGISPALPEQAADQPDRSSGMRL